MPDNPTPPEAAGDAQRRQLADAEREANAQQPGSFNDDAMTDKVVEVGKIDRDDSAIKGLDPK